MPRLPVVVDGDCDSRFDLVKQTFCNNFTQRWESEGAAFAVYLDGEKVVDLWGGYADTSARKKWKDDTMSLYFSCTKSICSICFAMLVDRGLVNYDDLVVQHWPEFGQNGKEKITIDLLIGHQAGLAYVDGVIEIADINDWTRMSKIFETQAANWTPGEFRGYHMITFGWIVDQLIRRIDPKKRSMSQFFKEELVAPYDLDIHMRVPPELEYRIARLGSEPKQTVVRELFERPAIFKFMWSMTLASVISSSNRILSKIITNVPWLGDDLLIFNNPEIRNLDMPAATAVGTARALAKLHSLVAEGKILKESTVEKLMTPMLVDKLDIVLNLPLSSGRGFFYTKNGYGQWTFGHPGMGGQNAKVDVANKLSFAYICNGMKTGIGDLTVTFMRLQNALYECLRKSDLLQLPETPALSSTQQASQHTTPTGAEAQETPGANVQEVAKTVQNDRAKESTATSESGAKSAEKSPGETGAHK